MKPSARFPSSCSMPYDQESFGDSHPEETGTQAEEALKCTRSMRFYPLILMELPFQGQPIIYLKKPRAKPRLNAKSDRINIPETRRPENRGI